MLRFGSAQFEKEHDERITSFVQSVNSWQKLRVGEQEGIVALR